MNAEKPKGEHVNISRSLTLDGWNYYKKIGVKYLLISKSEYLCIKQSNSDYSKKLREFREQLRNS